MRFVKEQVDLKPIVDTVFAIVKKAKEAKQEIELPVPVSEDSEDQKRASVSHADTAGKAEFTGSAPNRPEKSGILSKIRSWLRTLWFGQRR